MQPCSQIQGGTPDIRTCKLLRIRTHDEGFAFVIGRGSKFGGQCHNMLFCTRCSAGSGVGVGVFGGPGRGDGNVMVMLEYSDSGGRGCAMGTARSDRHVCGIDGGDSRR